MNYSQHLPFSKHTQVQEFDKQGLCLPTKKNKSFVKRFKKKGILVQVICGTFLENNFFNYYSHSS